MAKTQMDPELKTAVLFLAAALAPNDEVQKIREQLADAKATLFPNDAAKIDLSEARFAWAVKLFAVVEMMDGFSFSDPPPFPQDKAREN